MMALFELGKFLISHTRIIGYLGLALVVIFAGYKINHWREESKRVQPLINYSKKLEQEAIDYQASIEQQRLETQARLDTAKITAELQNKTIKQLRAENAKSPNIRINSDKLRAIQAADIKTAN